MLAGSWLARISARSAASTSAVGARRREVAVFFRGTGGINREQAVGGHANKVRAGAAATQHRETNLSNPDFLLRKRDRTTKSVHRSRLRRQNPSGSHRHWCAR